MITIEEREDHTSGDVVTHHHFAQGQPTLTVGVANIANPPTKRASTKPGRSKRAGIQGADQKKKARRSEL
jgi:hypothetical protein